MYKVQLLSCIALTLALITNSAPTSNSTKATQQQLEQLLRDLQMLLTRVKNYETPRLSMMFTFKFYTPKTVTELKHLQCLVDELKPLEYVLNVAPSKISTRDLISNINVTALELQGSETTFMCEYDEKAVTIEEFLDKWIVFCQSIIANTDLRVFPI